MAHFPPSSSVPELKAEFERLQDVGTVQRYCQTKVGSAGNFRDVFTQIVQYFTQTCAVDQDKTQKKLMKHSFTFLNWNTQ